MTPEDLDNTFNNIIRDIESDGMGRVMVQVGSAALALIRDRVQKTGQDAEGGQYKPYSTKPMLSGCKNMLKGSCEKVIGSKEKRREKKWVTLQSGGKNVHLFEIPGGYKEFREINGRQTGFVDFSFSGRMWANIKVVSDNSEHNAGVARIGTTIAEVNDILEGNTKRRTDILKLSKGELNDLSGMFNLGITQIFHNHGL